MQMKIQVALATSKRWIICSELGNLFLGLFLFVGIYLISLSLYLLISFFIYRQTKFHISNYFNYIQLPMLVIPAFVGFRIAERQKQKHCAEKDGKEIT